MITPLFLESIKKIVDMEVKVRDNKGNTDVLLEAKRMGFSDKYIGMLWGESELCVFELRKKEKMRVDRSLLFASSRSGIFSMALSIRVIFPIASVPK